MKYNGNIQSQTITVPTVGSSNGFTAVQTYNYDSLNRIDDAKEVIGSAETWKQDYTFDRYGNRNFVEANTTTIPKNCVDNPPPNPAICDEDRKIFNPSVNASNNRLSASDNYQFDAAGNTVRDPQNRKFTYDAENKQTKVETVDANGNVTGTIGQYSYDGDGLRVKKIAYANNQVSETTVFVYDASSRLVAEYSTILNETPQVAYLTNDHLGSPRINTNETGAVISRHDYRPYGEEITERTHAQYAGDSIRKQFTGYERDGETDLDFAQARYYTNFFGRFDTTDPENYGAAILDPQTWNGYAYVINNPSNLIDPDGLQYTICPTDGGKCYTHGDDLVRKAKEAGEYVWVGSRNPKTGLDSGTIQDADGNVIGTYNQTSHDSLVQQMLWGAQPTLQIWTPVIDNVLTPMVAVAGSPVTSGGAATTSVIGPAAAKSAPQIVKGSQLALNSAKGSLGEALALAKLAADGVEIVGTRVTAKLASGGKRVIDILVRVGDDVVAIEVKTGGATRGTAQLTKDAEMLAKGAKLVGKNAGELSGQFFDTIRTIVLQLP